MAEWPPMTRAHLSLREILAKMMSAAAAKDPRERVLAVFDLDSTLFDVGPRFEKVLLDFTLQKNFNEQFSDFKEIFRNIKVIKGDWGLKDVVERAGREHFSTQKIEPQKIQNFRRHLTEFWTEKFFTNEYLEFDVPYRGATQFVNSIAETNSDIVYLTGRDTQRMGLGSLKVLKKWGFPVDTEQHQLVLKPHKDIDDALFKHDWFAALPQGKYSQIWFFENEPVNIHLIRQSLPHIQIVFFDSTHSQQAHPPEDLPWIQDFHWDEEET